VLAELDGVFVDDDALDDAGILLFAAAELFLTWPGAEPLLCATTGVVATHRQNAAARK
jgi:hypothetical protein